VVSGVEQMMPIYYQVRGWTPEGVPETATLERLGL
jgi:aldehyde:ferredoxin oxidoreductase